MVRIAGFPGDKGLEILTVAVATTSNASGNIGPGTVSGLFVKVQSSHAVHLQLFTVDAAVENVADSWIRMAEETILARTELRGALGFLCNSGLVLEHGRN